MRATPDAVARWPDLDRTQLAEHLRAAVRAHYQNEAFWQVVRDRMQDNPVFGGKVRGLLHELAATAGVDAEWFTACVAHVRSWLTPHPQPDLAATARTSTAVPPPADGGHSTRTALHDTSAASPFRVEFRAPPTAAARRPGHH